MRKLTEEFNRVFGDPRNLDRKTRAALQDIRVLDHNFENAVLSSTLRMTRSGRRRFSPKPMSGGTGTKPGRACLRLRFTTRRSWSWTRTARLTKR
jgi:hypothetical protein